MTFNVSPVIPISAEKAFLYRAASRLSLNDFKEFNKDIVNKIGQEEFGMYRWKRLTKNQQFEKIFEVISDPEEIKERMSLCNFDTFLEKLDSLVGGIENQSRILREQLDVLTSKLLPHIEFANQLSRMYDQCIALEKSVTFLDKKFWDLFSKSKEQAFRKLSKSPSNIVLLQKPMQELFDYASGLHIKLHTAETSKSNEKIIVESMKNMVDKVCSFAAERGGVRSWRFPDDDTSLTEDWLWNANTNRWQKYNTGFQLIFNTDKTKHPEKDLLSHWNWNPNKRKWAHVITGYGKDGLPDQNPALSQFYSSTWANLSPYDVHTIVSSILIMIHNKHFCENFGYHISHLEWLRGNSRKDSSSKVVDFMKGSYSNGKFIPSCMWQYRTVVHVDVPESLEDPSHWGHIAWMFCKFMDSCDSKTKA